MQRKGFHQDSCILSKFYIKPQLRTFASARGWSCILSKFYIKPQPGDRQQFRRGVVSYRNSTSNHNILILRQVSIIVVSYRNSTSNHNIEGAFRFARTVVSYRNSTSNHNSGVGVNATMSLYLIEILHQTTTLDPARFIRRWLYLIEILHQTTTSGLILIDKVLLTGCLPL